MSISSTPKEVPDEHSVWDRDPLNGQDLKMLVEAALSWLKTNQQTINMLNVFPVPDGDTGTNMVLTMQAAYNEIQDSGERNIGKMAHKVAQGALMGARGNSGVILSQLWRGFARALDNLDVMDGKLFVRALVEARNTAYKGVVRPVEGTILTVAKDISAVAEAALSNTEDIYAILDLVVTEGENSVKRTPELLPILKTAGVVDAGGKGLLCILEGMQRHIKGLSLDAPVATIQPLANMDFDHALESVEPGQDYEVVIDFVPEHPLDLDHFYNDLSGIGTSIQVGEGDGLYRMHIHVPIGNVNEPFAYMSRIGTILKESRENLRAQISENRPASEPRISFAPVEPGQIALVAVSPGPGISRIFASLGANAIIEGGQTMNPSTEEILQSFENLPTDKVIILPNNKNIVLAAQSAATLTVKQVSVVKSMSVPQGLAAILRLSPDGDLQEVTEEMNTALKEVETGEITTATRSVKMNGVQVEKGQVIALLDGKLIYSASSIEEACLGLLARAHTAERERITLLYGSEMKRQDVNILKDKIRSVYQTQELEDHEGGQPHYQLILSIE